MKPVVIGGAVIVTILWFYLDDFAIWTIGDTLLGRAAGEVMQGVIFALLVGLYAGECLYTLDRRGRSFGVAYYEYNPDATVRYDGEVF